MRSAPVKPPALAAIVATLAGTVLATGSPATAAEPTVVAADAALTATLDQVLADPRLAGSTTAMQVRDAATGAVVYAHHTDLRVVPASNQKLLTSVAALEVLGAEYRFHTVARYTGRRTGRTVTGNLHLHGQGDPTMTYARFDALAAAVARTGITRFTGSLVADDSWFDRVPLGLDWSWQDETYADNAPISALTVAADDRFDAGAVEVRSRPGPAAGDPAVLALTPANSVVRIINRTVTGKAGTAGTVSATRVHGTDRIVVTGSSPLAARAAGTSLVSVRDPAPVAAGVFRDALARHGVTVAGRTTTGTTPDTARTVADQASIPLRRLLPWFLKLSNNGHAELLVKAMGRAASPTSPGSWPTGLAAATAALARLGVDPERITMGDGSGLSRRNWLTTTQLAGLLYAAQRRPWFAAWYASLPIAGNPDPLVGGTLRSRMRGTPAAGNVHAKTGTLTGVNALSGYVRDRAGRRLVFASVSNAAPANVSDILDRAAVALAGSGGTAPALPMAKRLPPVARHVVTRAGRDVECSWVPDAC